ncbi:MAG: NnrS family protein [Xanthobacteraceae bacterium]|nr:NnrS family protein [Xanthobacteraceae bacterium]MCW5675597.1 NnrS family protein [Xanthobacteraceae bacterium]
MTDVDRQPIRLPGSALFSYGFRPFFLFGAIYAGLAVLLWLHLFRTGGNVETRFHSLDWHVHEMLYGFVPAIVTGFLLTAIPNWTKRLPVRGLPLFALFLLWVAGRVAVFNSAQIGWATAAAIDVAFLLVVAAVAVREIVAGQNWRNLRVIGVVSVLTAGNLIFHLEAHYRGSADFGTRIGLSAVILLISLVGGRIVPSFTHNWLARQSAGRMPASFGRFDAASIVISLFALIAWIMQPASTVTAFALLAGGIAQGWRFLRWAGERAARAPIVLVLHAAYAFIPLGFVLLAFSALGEIPRSAGIHAWTAGATGTMILAVMTRASLGHTGRALVASPAVQAIYLAVIMGALFRILGSLMPEWNVALLTASGVIWSGGFLGFALVYGPILCSPAVGEG